MKGRMNVYFCGHVFPFIVYLSLVMPSLSKIASYNKHCLLIPFILFLSFFLIFSMTPLHQKRYTVIGVNRNSGPFWNFLRIYTSVISLMMVVFTNRGISIMYGVKFFARIIWYCFIYFISPSDKNQ